MLLAWLAMLGPFAIDTYIPAFSAIGKALDATPEQMQQTLSAYLLSFAFMSLFHGALSDRFGRRIVVLCGLVLFTLASIGCALAPTVGWLIVCRALQGFSAGVGIVIARAVTCDLFSPIQAQKIISQITIFFGIAPVIAPIIGGVFSDYLSWQAIFWFMAAMGALLWVSIWRLLPESLPISARQPLDIGNLLSGYSKLLRDRRFLLLAVVYGIPFNGAFLYILSAPVFLGQILHLAPRQFFWLFAFNTVGLIAGLWLSGRMAGRAKHSRQVMMGFWIMLATSLLNLILNLMLIPRMAWALWPIALFSLGWALTAPVVTLLALGLHPERRGMASSLQSVVGLIFKGLVAGLIAPAVMHSAIGLALTSFAFMAAGLACWVLVRKWWPEIGVSGVA
ncbi:MAG: multidrug effflux MFS transporter [Burkholderiaceae bacterium]|nr:multidrug effflux MFS transporter [Burkholderiaceae bacterium]